MTQEEEMYEMAWQAGCVNTPIGELKRFAALVAAKATANEREAQEDARQPLTDSQITAARRAYPAEDLCGWSYRMGIADAEKHHGITAAPKGVQHGTE